ncbi:MAG: Lon family ATP-dependent protease [Selenomonadaceae bacterium]|nr:Lon family ATP-dependent protease [Selenomonadaceae bacterium]
MFRKFFGDIKKAVGSDDNQKSHQDSDIEREIAALYSILVDVMGSDRLVLQAGKMDALRYMRSADPCERVLALRRIIEENPTLYPPPKKSELQQQIVALSEHIADIMARRQLEDKIERKITEKLEKEHQEYVKDIRMQILKEEKPDAESPHDVKKRVELQELDEIHLTQSVMELLRPQSLEEIVGQERAVKSLRSKLASPYPQHLILYGPPGVGKTTAARLVLEAVRGTALSPFKKSAPFVETDGTTLRWDPRDVTNPLLGSVHDPIYQGAQRQLAESGVPEPKPGLVTEAHGGILFIDEIGEMDLMLQNKLLKVLEDKRVFFESSYYDPADERVPPYVKMLFEKGAPADFVLIGATTRDASSINPALRSRCAEIYFEPLTPAHIVEIVRNAAQKLNVALDDEIAEKISEYTIEGRKAINILADAYSLALERDEHETLSIDRPIKISKHDIYEVAQVSRLYQFVTKKASSRATVGHIFGLGVSGFVGSVIEIEAVVFPAAEKGKGTIRFNETAGSMAKDSVFNAASVLRATTGKDIHDFDVHINVIGGGNIDGPSAGTAILTALVSAVTGKKIRQDAAVTGEISLQGKVRPVGGVFEKAYGAKQAGIKTLIIPKENAKDIPLGHLGLNIFAVETAQEAFDKLLTDDDEPAELPAPEIVKQSETVEEMHSVETQAVEETPEEISEDKPKPARRKVSMRKKRISRPKDLQIKKISSTTVTPEELEMLTTPIEKDEP